MWRSGARRIIFWELLGARRQTVAPSRADLTVGTLHLALIEPADCIVATKPLIICRVKLSAEYGAQSTGECLGTSVRPVQVSRQSSDTAQAFDMLLHHQP